MGSSLSMSLEFANSFREGVRTFWGFVREVSGDDAYERYLKRHAETHPDLPPLSRQAFFAAEQNRKWNGVKRCC